MSAGSSGGCFASTTFGTPVGDNADISPRWASETFAQPGRRGRQHWVQHMTFEGTADGVTVRSYWKVVQGRASTNTRTLNAMGFYDDFCVKFDGRWLIKEKRIYRCNDETPLPW